MSSTTRDRGRRRRWGELSAWFRSPATLCPIHTPREFRRTIDRECVRANRYRTRFSLAVFEVGTRNENSVLIRRLVRTIHNRFRDTDELGWYDDRQIGIIMPFTPAEGAWTLAEYISRLISHVTVPPPFTIYSYPSQNWPRKGFLEKYFPFLNVVAMLRETLALKAPRAEEFHALIGRERSRADRNGHIFSLVVFRLNDPERVGRSARRLVITMNRRLRDTDDLGWYDEQHIGVILPYMTQENAARMAQSICKEAPPSVVREYKVYTYPDSWVSGGGTLADGRNPSEAEAGKGVSRRNWLLANGLEPDALMGEERGDEAEPQRQAASGFDESFLYPPVPRWKRTLDVTGSALGILLFSPLFLLTALVIKMVSPGPVFFRQERVGYRQQAFTLLKFRTMKADADPASHREYMKQLIAEGGEAQPMTKMERNPNIIPLGRAIRSLSLDELPQLFNVFRGDMSLVGPRPCLPYEAEEYLRWHTRRFYSLPGMSGLWQVSGKNRTTFQEMIRLDIKYDQTRSLWLDLKIILKTPLVLLSQLLGRS